MSRPAIAIVTGFTKSDTLLRRSFAPLRNLKRRGVLQRIVYVTWDRPDIDLHVEAAQAMPDVELVRMKQPDLSGPRLQAGVAYQIENLGAALALIPQDDALIVKTRPDLIIDEDFLGTKIAGFNALCAPSDLAHTFGVAMPPSPFAAKLWIPWADANLPLHYEDAAFIGLKCDVAKLADSGALARMDSSLLSGKPYGWFAHVARYARVFSQGYSIFDNYVRNFRYFANDTDYRRLAMPATLKETFFWRLIVANAWILATNFHVDCGQPGQLAFYTNSSNRNADWSSLHALKIHPPYNAVAEWRAAQHPGGMLHCVGRLHARLVDDSWQQALFTRAELSDLTPDNLRAALHAAAQYRHDVPDMSEQSLYRALDGAFRAHFEQAYADGTGSNASL
jgi:hypothetical protein